jgi:hypothetical protein
VPLVPVDVVFEDGIPASRLPHAGAR